MYKRQLYNSEGRPSLDDEILGYPYADVPGDAWFADAVYWARLNNVVLGYGDENFGPNDPITREQLMTILYRYEQLQGGGFTGDWAFNLDFNDADQVSDWAYEATCWCTMNGLSLIHILFLSPPVSPMAMSMMLSIMTSISARGLMC